MARYLDPVLDTERFPPLPALGWERAYPHRRLRPRDRRWPGVRRPPRRPGQDRRPADRARRDRRASCATLPAVRAAVTVVRESDAGNKLLVAYVVGEVEPRRGPRRAVSTAPAGACAADRAARRAAAGQRRARSTGARSHGPPPASAAGAQSAGLGRDGRAGWPSGGSEQLGPVALTVDSDFFELGGSSLAAAKLTSTVRERFPAVAVADVYNHRRLGELSGPARSRSAPAGTHRSRRPPPSGRRWGAIRLAGLLALLALAAPPVAARASSRSIASRRRARPAGRLGSG